jgi:hypothetical protein
MTKAQYASRVEGRGSEVKTGKTWNRNTERNHRVSMYSHRNNVTMWTNVAKCCKYTEPHACVWNTANICTFIAVSVQTGVRLVVHTCDYSAVSKGAHVALRWGAGCARGKDTVLERSNASRPVILHHGFQMCSQERIQWREVWRPTPAIGRTSCNGQTTSSHSTR